MRIPTRHGAQRGLSLVELMIAIVISLILMAGVIQIYLSSRQGYRVTSDQARMQENGRYAMHFLVTDIRQAGYSGCGGIDVTTNTSVISKNPPVNGINGATQYIYGYDGNGTWPANFPAQPANLVANTSVLQLQFGSSASAYLTGQMNDNAANIQVSANPGNWVAGDNLLITDCRTATLFTATTVAQGNGGIITIAHASNANTQNTMAYAYGPDAQVMSYVDEIYYIGYDSNDKDINGASRPALYREINGNTQVLVDNVQDMQLLYGISNNSTMSIASVSQWLTATQVTSANYWPSTAQVQAGSPTVVAVRINLLMSTQNDYLAPTPQSLTFNGAIYNAGDRRLYWTFGDTVTIRNGVH